MFLLVTTSHFFSFTLAKPTLLVKKVSSRRNFCALSKLCPPLPAHGAAAGSFELHLLLTKLKSCLLQSFQFTLWSSPVRQSTGIALADEGAHTATEQDLNS